MDFRNKPNTIFIRGEEADVVDNNLNWKCNTEAVLEMCCCYKFQGELSQSGKMSHFKHWMCSQCFIVNKILVFETFKLLHSIFIYILHSLFGIGVMFTWVNPSKFLVFHGKMN